MARNITIQTEGLIAITIFILFLLFFIGSYNINFYYFQNKIYGKSEYLDSFVNSLKREYYIVSLNVTIPKYVKELCNNNNLKYDTCERFPIYYPLNISFLTDYNGILNNTYDTLFDKEFGAFFYTNFSEFNLCDDKNYTLIEIYNPNGYDLKDYQIFITNPTIYYWLKQGYRLLVIDENNNNVQFCYMHDNFICDNNSINSYGIWIKINISANGKKLLNISLSNQNYATDGKNIFDFYDQFNYKSLINFDKNWNRIIPKGSINFSNIGDISILCVNYSFPTDLRIKTTSRTSLSKGNKYQIFYKISYYSEICTSTYCYLDIDANEGQIIISGISNDFYKKSEYFDLLTFNVNLSTDSNITIDLKSDISTLLCLYLDYIIVKKYSDSEPIYRTIYQPTCYKTYNFILGPEIIYNFSKYKDISFYNSSLTNMYIIQNNKLKYIENSSLKSLEDIYGNYFLRNLSFYSSEPFPMSNIKTKNISAFFYYSDNNFTVKKILFSNSSWFIIDMFYNTSIRNIPIWNNNGDILNGDPTFYYYGIPFFIENGPLYNPFISYSNRKFISNVSNNYLYILSSKDDVYTTHYYSQYYSYYWERFNFTSISDIDKIQTYVLAFSKSISKDDLIDLYFLFTLPKINSSIQRVKTFTLSDIKKAKGFFIEELSYLYGNITNYSKRYYDWLFYNNTLIKASIIIYS